MGEGEDRREACSSGVCLFLRALVRAHSHPFGLAIADGRWRRSIPPGGRRRAARGGPPQRSRAQEVLRSGGSGAAGAAAAPQPGTLAAHPRRLGFLSPRRRARTGQPSADRAAVRARRAPRSVQLFFFRGPELGRGDAGGPFGREERRAWSVVARRLHLLHQGWHHLPEGARRRGRFSWSGCAPGTLGVWETDPKRLSLPRRASDF